jgi:hypothetical protein
MRPIYFKTDGSAYLAFNAKAASSLLACALVRRYHPAQRQRLESALMPAGYTPDNHPYQHWACPRTHRPDAPVHLLVRDPVERFASAMAQMRRVDGDAVLDELEAGGPLARNSHFHHQIACTGHGQVTYLYRMPEHMDALAEALDIDLADLPPINAAAGPKPTFTQSQTRRITDYYADDLALYQSITTPATTPATTTTPTPAGLAGQADVAFDPDRRDAAIAQAQVDYQQAQRYAQAPQALGQLIELLIDKGVIQRSDLAQSAAELIEPGPAGPSEGRR